MRMPTLTYSWAKFARLTFVFGTWKRQQLNPGIGTS